MGSTCPWSVISPVMATSRTHRAAGQARHQRRCQRYARRRTVALEWLLPARVCGYRYHKNGNIIAVSLRMGFCVGDGKLGALFHYLAQRTRQFQPSCAGHCLHLDGRYLAAHAGPRKAIGHAHGVLTAEKAGFTRFGPKISSRFLSLTESVSTSPAAMRLAHLRSSSVTARSRLHTRFLRISVDQAVQRGVRQLHTAFQARGSELLGQQVTLGDLELFHARIAESSITSIRSSSGRGMVSVVIGRGDKQHIAQVKRDIQIVILERDVLLRVQRFQQGGGRVARKSLAILSTSSSRSSGFALFAVRMG